MTNRSRARALPIFAAAAMALCACKGKPGAGPPIIEHFAAAPASINPGDSAVLSWTVENRSHIVIDQGVGDVTSQTQALVRPAASTTYTLTAVNADGVSTAQTTVTVTETEKHAVHLSLAVQASTEVAGGRMR